MQQLLHYCLLVILLNLTCLNYTNIIAQSYNPYYGNIHSHSGYSDGNADSLTSNLSTPMEDYDYANTALCMDFLGISDHNHSLAGMDLEDFHTGLMHADAANVDGSFVALYGYEWGVISQGGHVLVYGVPNLIGWESGNYDIYNTIDNYDSLFIKVAATPDAFTTLAHPSNSDFQSLATTHAYNATIDNALVGTCMRNGPAFSTNTTYSDSPNTNYEPYYQRLLAKGYHVGPLIDHDDHNTTLGHHTSGRTVVLVSSLTRTNVIDAFRSNRFYASDDCNAIVNYTIATHPMGSVFVNAGNPTLQIAVTDGNAENVSKIFIKYGVPGSGTNATILTSNSNQNTLSYTHSISNNSSYYYYAVIVQPDGDTIFTSPIWYTRNDAFLPVTIHQFDVAYQNSKVLAQWQTSYESCIAYIVQRSSDKLSFVDLATLPATGIGEQMTSYSYTDEYPLDGESYYRLKVLDSNGDYYYSDIQTVFIHIGHVTVTNPVTTQSVQITGLPATTLNGSFGLYDLTGKCLSTFPILQDGRVDLGFLLPANGLYIYTIQDDNKHSFTGKVIF
ncbi:MAG: T9SS type A sorting domain-containing protein, partial [Saprospiraceae bacterium]